MQGERELPGVRAEGIHSFNPLLSTTQKVRCCCCEAVSQHEQEPTMSPREARSPSDVTAMGPDPHPLSQSSLGHTPVCSPHSRPPPPPSGPETVKQFTAQFDLSDRKVPDPLKVRMGQGRPETRRIQKTLASKCPHPPSYQGLLWTRLSKPRPGTPMV